MPDPIVHPIAYINSDEMFGWTCLWDVADESRGASWSRSNIAASWKVFEKDPQIPFIYDEYLQPHIPTHRVAAFTEYLEETFPSRQERQEQDSIEDRLQRIREIVAE